MTPRSPSAPGASLAMAAAARRIILKVPTRLMLMVFAKDSRRCGPSRPTTFSEGAMPAQLTRHMQMAEGAGGQDRPRPERRFRWSRR